MSWQDRDYASEEGYHQAVGRRLLPPITGMLLTTQLIILNVVIHVLNALVGPPEFPRLIRWGAMHTELVMEGQVWRLITSQYLHAGAMHLFFNMLGLYFLGRYLEQYWGRRKFFVFYTACGLAGNLFFMLLNLVGWLEVGLAVGASGCILGVLGACAVLFPGIQLIVYFFPMKIRTAAALFLGLYVFNLLDRGFNAGGDAAHLAGLVLGVGYALWCQYGGGGGSRPITRARVVSGAGAWKRKLRHEADRQQEVDRILSKIHEQGISSLSEHEKLILSQASREQESSENRYGRIDRL